MLTETPNDMLGVAATPAANHLFVVDQECKKLSTEESETFHHLIAKLLYLSRRARPDIQTAVGYLTTRVSNPDEDDYKELSRVVKYLRATIDLTLTLEATNGLSILKWWVDGSFGVHPDLRSHSGGVMSAGGGAIVCRSNKQKLNSKSLTEAELIAVDDNVGQILWTKLFLKEQGYNTNSVLHQDNQSTILLENNG